MSINSLPAFDQYWSFLCTNNWPIAKLDIIFKYGTLHIERDQSSGLCWSSVRRSENWVATAIDCKPTTAAPFYDAEGYEGFRAILQAQRGCKTETHTVQRRLYEYTTLRNI